MGKKPEPGSPEWQEQLNEQTREHDRQFEEQNPNWEQEHGGGK